MFINQIKIKFVHFFSVAKSHRLLLLSFLFFFLFATWVRVFATPPTSPYTAGATLDPACAPGDTACTVGILESRDEGTNLTYQTTALNFVGSGVTATNSSGVVTVTISGGGSGVDTIGTFSGSAQTNGASISGTTITFGPASATVPGMVSTGTQTFAGAKTFSSAPTFSSLTAGSVFFGGTSGLLQEDNSNFFWDDTNNRLGIGTTSPSSALHVSGVNTTNSQARIGSLEFQTYAVNNAWLGENVYFDGTVFRARNAGTGGLFYFAGDEGQFRFKTSLIAGDSWGAGFSNFKVNADGTVALGGTGMSVTNGDYSGATLVATAAGRVGIGVASPSAPLHVTGANSGADFYASVLVTGGGNIVLTGTGANSPTISLYPDINDTSAYVSNYYNSSDNAYYIQSVGLATSDIILRNFSTGAKVVMDENGKFGIGDDTPNSLLTVGAGDLFQVDTSGNIATTGTLSAGNGASFAVNVNGAITAATGITSSGNITLSGLNTSLGVGDVVCIDGSNLLMRDSSGACAPSSQRFKHDIVSVDSSLSMVNQLRPVSFKYNGSQKMRFGFIAEEVDQIDPELVVREADGVTPHGVYYIDMIPLLAKSIQELDVKINGITNFTTENSFIIAFRSWISSALNGIENIFSNKITTKNICISDTECLTEQDIRNLINTAHQGYITDSPIVPQSEPTPDVPVDVPITDEVIPPAEPTPTPELEQPIVETSSPTTGGDVPSAQ